MKYLKVFTDFAGCLEPLNQAEVGRLFLAMLSYAADGTEPELSGNERFIWPAAKMNIDASAKSYDALVSNAKTARDSRSKANLRRSKAKASYSYDCLALEEDKDKEKDKDKDKENNIPPIIPPVQELPDSIRWKAEEWLSYKKERRESYKPQGLRSFVTQVKTATEQYGASAVAELIDISMANGYQGITWDRLKGGRNASNRGHPQRHVPGNPGNLGETI